MRKVLLLLISSNFDYLGFLRLNINIYIYIYIYTHTFIYIYLYISISISISIYTHTHTHSFTTCYKGIKTNQTSTPVNHPTPPSLSRCLATER